MRSILNICIIIMLNFSLLISCSQTQRVASDNLVIEFNDNMHSRIIAKFDYRTVALGGFMPSEFVVISGDIVTDFRLKNIATSEITDNVGQATQVILSGESAGLNKEVHIQLYNEFPSMAVYQVKYTNTGTSVLTIDSWTNNAYEFNTTGQDSVWSFQGGSYESRPDWVLPVKQGFDQSNYQGMNATDYGGGIPVSDIWRQDAGLGIGHVAMVPKLVSLPVSMPGADAALVSVTRTENVSLEPGASFTTLKTFVCVHNGDYFKTLTEYRNFMIAQGIKFDTPPETVYEPVWCAWGYERNFTMEQIYNTLPKVKELGYEWAVLDDGYQTAEGDWYLLKDKFPRGDRDMKKFVATIHSYGLQAKLWWAPMAVDPGTDLIKDHPEYLLLNEDGSKQKISWWDAYYLCPASKEVQEYTRDLVIKIMKEWGYEGLKIDGQHLNGAPPCYNPAHNHAYPEEAFEKVPEFFKVIYETALEINPQAVVEICPCGATHAFHTLPYYNQSVSSDPESSWQIRLKGKTLKALMGPSAPYYGDHVELSDGRSDFASTVGIGAIVGTKFTWPVGAKKDSRVDLTPEKEIIWKKWTQLYLEKMLPKGTYEGTLYDIGFDKPEAHAIRKADKMYYAFYANKWQGPVELRGLAEKNYQVLDYVNNTDYGTVSGPKALIDVEFDNYLLLEAVPQ